MSKILNVKPSDDYVPTIKKRNTKKTQVFLYDTQRRYGDFISKLKYRNNGEYEDIPHYVIKKNGDIVEIFDKKYSTYTFGVKPIDNRMVKIALENLGWLTKNTITGVLYNWIGDIYRSDPYVKKWRGYYFWDRYSEEQMMSLRDLTIDVCGELKMPFLSVPSQGYLSNVSKFNGIVCKSNFLNIYTDINPSFNFKIFDNEK